MELHLATNLDIILDTIIQDLKKLLMKLRNLKRFYVIFTKNVFKKTINYYSVAKKAKSTSKSTQNF